MGAAASPKDIGKVVRVCVQEISARAYLVMPMHLIGERDQEEDEHRANKTHPKLLQLMP